MKRMEERKVTISRAKISVDYPANFILVEVDGAQELMRQSQADKVLLRYFGGSLDGCVRITIGSREENDRMLESLQRLERADA